MDRQGADETIAVLSRRVPVLRRLDDGGPARKADLVDALDVSRSTVDRAIRSLENEGFVRRSEGRYELTLAGRLVREEYDALVEVMGGLEESREVLRSLSPDLDLPPALFRGARVTTPTREDPHRPHDRVEAMLAASDRHRTFVSAFLPHHVSLYERHVSGGETAVDVVATQSVLERLLRDHRELVATASDSERVSVRVCDASVPFSLRISESDERTAVGVMVYGERGPRGFVESTAPGAVKWARSFLDDLWAAATPVDEGLDRPE